uniref:Uncharacterized protein n=1 Tax=Ciona savignyi TaxID=51511 RepID=H2YM44_CIOSA
MQEGMIFTIEPILMDGAAGTRKLSDGWTVVAIDHGLSAQSEHTILITDSGCEVLT